MTIYSLDILLFLFGTSLLFHCPGVSPRGVGQRWPAAGLGALSGAVLKIKSPGSCGGHKRLKLPENWEDKKVHLEWQLQGEEKEKISTLLPSTLAKCAARGKDYEEVKLLEISVKDVERWKRKKRKNPDLGFSDKNDYAAAQLHQYHRLTKQIRPDIETYKRLERKAVSQSVLKAYVFGKAFHPTSSRPLHRTYVPSKKKLLETSLYTNERNAKFNKKAKRFYEKYTAEINLERGNSLSNLLQELF
ncbi:hypothetical protein AB1E18_000928 [Capra hircus]